MRRWSLNRKVWLVVGLLTFSFVGTTLFQSHAMHEVTADLDEISGPMVRLEQLTSQFLLNQRAARIATFELVVYQDSSRYPEIQKRFDDALERQEKNFDEYDKIAHAADKALLAEYRTQWKTISDHLRGIGAHGMKNDIAAANKALIAAEPELKRATDHLGKMMENTGAELMTITAAAEKEAGESIRASTFIAVLSISISLTVAFLVLRALSSSISAIVTGLFESSAQVSTAAGEIAKAADSLSQATAEQAASVEQTASSIEEMNQMVGRNSQNAGFTAKTSSQSQAKADEGRAIIEKMIQSMEEINQSNTAIMGQVTDSNERFREIVQVIEEIAGKTNVINDIVFQTKLLSFNASVEAARAGEHGKGFAVVAEEVGSLAQMSGNAAKEIRELLDGSLKKVNDIVINSRSKVEGLVEAGRKTVVDGTDIARQCGDVLDEIVTNVSSVSKLATEIAAASDEQSKGVSEITKAMAQLDQVTQINAATSEQCASAAEELSAQAVSLKTAVSDLVLTVEGGVSETVEVKSPSKRLNNVVTMPTKAPLRKSQNQTISKNVSGDVTPAYDSDGFRDI